MHKLSLVPKMKCSQNSLLFYTVIVSVIFEWQIASQNVPKFKYFPSSVQVGDQSISKSSQVQKSPKSGRGHRHLGTFTKFRRFLILKTPLILFIVLNFGHLSSQLKENYDPNLKSSGTWTGVLLWLLPWMASPPLQAQKACHLPQGSLSEVWIPYGCT